jgi:hypothetical protein
MYNSDVYEIINDEPFSIYSLITYVKENIIGLLLLLFSILIVIFVDYLSRINTMIYSSPNMLPSSNVFSAIPIPQIKPLTKIHKNKKFRKH